jgi:4-hydroxy-2-oxoheptanedioate aldolase
MLGVVGFDFVLIDCEHGPADVVALRHHVTAADLHGMAVLVRIGAAENALALRALDQGAQGIVAPHVDTAPDADALVRAVHYPPRGDRGFATYPRAGRFGTVDPLEHQRRAADSTLAVAMLESPAAVREARAILQTDGIDAYLVGAADLRAASGDGDPTVPESLDLVHAAGRDAAVARMDIVPDAAGAEAALADGAQLVVYNLTQCLVTLLRQLHDIRRP